MRSRIFKRVFLGFLYSFILLGVNFMYVIPLAKFYLPGLFNQDLSYSKLSNISTKEVGYENKVIESINLVLVNPSFSSSYPSDSTATLKEKIDNTSDWQEGTFTGDDFNNLTRDSVLHLKFTDKTTMDLPVNPRELYGNFDQEIVDGDLAKKMNYRFPSKKISERRYPLGFLLRLYPGDTFFKPATSLISFAIKNPQSGKQETYYTYGGFRDGILPVFLTQEKLSADKPLKNGKTYQFKQGSKDPERQIFDHVSFDDLPLGITDTGYQFKVDVTIRQTEYLEDGDKLLVKTKTFTYDESNKDQYISDILDYLD